MGVRIIQVDAFTDRPYAGNPAAVCLLEAERPAGWMQRVAAEMNLSETAFPVPAGDGWRLRWFTPAAEVPLCGHATLATAHVLWTAGGVDMARELRFETASGELRANRRGGEIELDVPALAVTAVDPPAGLLEALGAGDAVEGVHAQGDELLVHLSSAAAVRGLRPDFAALRRLDLEGVVVTAVSDDAAFDIVSRYFAPWVGIDEDPVTGSAHCRLAPFWRHRLGRDELRAHQASKRGGALRVTVRDDRVLLTGRAVTVLDGRLVAEP